MRTSSCTGRRVKRKTHNATEYAAPQPQASTAEASHSGGRRGAGEVVIGANSRPPVAEFDRLVDGRLHRHGLEPLAARGQEAGRLKPSRTRWSNEKQRYIIGLIPIIPCNATGRSTVPSLVKLPGW